MKVNASNLDETELYSRSYDPRKRLSSTPSKRRVRHVYSHDDIDLALAKEDEGKLSAHIYDGMSLPYFLGLILFAWSFPASGRSIQFLYNDIQVISTRTQFHQNPRNTKE